MFAEHIFKFKNRLNNPEIIINAFSKLLNYFNRIEMLFHDIKLQNNIIKFNSNVIMRDPLIFIKNELPREQGSGALKLLEISYD